MNSAVSSSSIRSSSSRKRQRFSASSVILHQTPGEGYSMIASSFLVLWYLQLLHRFTSCACSVRRLRSQMPIPTRHCAASSRAIGFSAAFRALIDDALPHLETLRSYATTLLRFCHRAFLYQVSARTRRTLVRRQAALASIHRTQSDTNRRDRSH